jgi:DNA-binding transcriptional LysR family regulator
MDETDRIERRLKLHDLRVLMSVVEQGSMGKAAELLATSQPAVSRAIADLEHSLGVRLLDRGPRGIAPTPYGRAFIKRALPSLMSSSKASRTSNTFPTRQRAKYASGLRSA